ncbi:MAG: cytochrome b/b6 domain-containing protein [Nitrosomonadales bacterium]|nr:cytochrome b/b6 domain-containing protein [Nitrosomonadales bacterium]
MEKILVWDIPTRIGHWLLVTAFAVSYLSGDSETWRLVHVTAGFAVGGVLAFRLFWGMAGTRYARFSSFLFSPREVFSYLRGLLQGKPGHWVGHNPAGSYAIYALLLLGLAVVGSGWAVYADVGGDWLEEVHDTLSYVMLGVVGIHVAGVAVSSRLHHENLVRSMITGYKNGRREEGIASGKGLWIILLLGLVMSAAAAGLLS